jgi:O-methyltransferase
MSAPTTYTHTILSRAAGFCAGQGKKTLIVCSGAPAKTAAQNIAMANMSLHVDVHDASGLAPDQAPFEPNSKYGAVLTVSDTGRGMLTLRHLSRNYQAAGVPVVALEGWPLPVDGKQFQRDIVLSGNITTPGMFDLAARFCGGMPGDYFEFGTFLGFTLQCAYHAFNIRNPSVKRRFIAFDSFAGIVGAKSSEGFNDGDYAASVASFRFANTLAEVPNDRVLAIEGPYQETIVGPGAEETRRSLGETSAAVVHIDCDVEEPAKLALDFVIPYVQQGTLLLFDEYDLHRADNAKGERAALRAWLKENPQFEVEPYRAYHVHARAFILHKR